MQQKNPGGDGPLGPLAALRTILRTVIDYIEENHAESAPSTGLIMGVDFPTNGERSEKSVNSS